MHVVVCMSPIGDAFRNRLRQYPALINCTTIDWFLEWPREALLEVGNKFLMNLNLTLTITGETKPVGCFLGRYPSSSSPPSDRSIPFDSDFSGIEHETLELLEKAGWRGRTASTSSLFRGIRLFSSRRLALPPSGELPSGMQSSNSGSGDQALNIFEFATITYRASTLTSSIDWI